MNHWKIAFFSLAAIVAAVIVVVVILLSKGNEHEVTFDHPVIDREPIFFVETSKERLNQFVQSQLQSLKYNREHFDFTVELNDYVHVAGYVTVFDQKLNFRMQLNPVVQQNGNLLLEQQYFYIGEMPIPSKQVLKIIRSSIDLPKWINVAPENEVIYINFDKMKLNDTLRMKVKKLDLKNDDLLFEIYER